MAYTARSLVAIASGPSGAIGTNAQQIYSYITADAQATIVAADYFLAEKDKLKVGDLIFAVGAYAGTETLSIYVVQSVTSATVTITKNV